MKKLILVLLISLICLFSIGCDEGMDWDAFYKEADRYLEYLKSIRPIPKNIWLDPNSY